MIVSLSSMLAFAAVAAAGPILPRTVASLDEGATAEAQQRDNTATRAFSNTQIKVWEIVPPASIPLETDR